MPRAISDTAKSAVTAQETAEVFAALLTIDHPSIADGPIRLANQSLVALPAAGTRGIVSRGDEFIFLPFDFILPGQAENRTPNTILQMDNVHRDITATARKLTSPATVKVEVVLISDPDTVEISVEGFSLINIEYDAFVIRGTLTTELLDQRPFPSMDFTASGFPGIF